MKPLIFGLLGLLAALPSMADAQRVRVTPEGPPVHPAGPPVEAMQAVSGNLRSSFSPAQTPTETSQRAATIAGTAATAPDASATAAPSSASAPVAVGPPPAKPEPSGSEDGDCNDDAEGSDCDNLSRGNAAALDSDGSAEGWGFDWSFIVVGLVIGLAFIGWFYRNSPDP